MNLRLLPLALLAIATPVAAQQQSQSYKFLEAVRKADGNTVNQMLAEPGQRLIDVRDRSTGETALHIVAKRDDALYTRFLLAKGADANVRTGNGDTALMLAVQVDGLEVIDALIAGGADPNVANGAGETPLIRAVQLTTLPLGDRVSIVRKLLAAGANPDQTDHVAGLSARSYAQNDRRSSAILKVIEETPRARPRVVAGPKL